MIINDKRHKSIVDINWERQRNVDVWVGFSGGNLKGKMNRAFSK